MSYLRYFMTLALVVWIGGIIFFAFVVAPTLFAVLPSTQLAASVVAPTLGKLHIIGLVCGLIFLFSSLLESRLCYRDFQPLSSRNFFVMLMMAVTCISQFFLTPKLTALRAQLGSISTLPITHPGRVAFDSLHVWSTRLEGAILLMGLLVIYLVAASSIQDTRR